MSNDIRSERIDLPQGQVNYLERGSGRPVVFLHGLLMAGSLWGDVMSRLDGLRCIALDLPLGAHRTALREEADTSPPGVATMVEDFLEALGLEDVVLVGNDTGGAIAQILCARQPERVTALVLTNCDAYENFLPPGFRYLQLAARLPFASDLAVQSMRIRPLRRTPLSFGWLAKPGRLSDELLESWIRPALGDAGVRRDARKFLRGISAKDTIEAARRLRTFDRPVLIAWGSEDRHFKLRFGERLAQEIPNAEFVRVDDSRTLVALDQPARLAELIADFAAAKPAPRP